MKSILILDRKSDPYKKKYEIDNNDFHIKHPEKQMISFYKMQTTNQYSVYEQGDVNHQIIYDSVLQYQKTKKFNSFVVFNGNSNLSCIEALIQNITSQKIFQQKLSTLAVFEVRKNKIYDLQKGNNSRKKSVKMESNDIYDVDSTREHHLIYTKNIEEVQQSLVFLPFSQSRHSKNISGTFNKFFILKIQDCVRIVIININDKLPTQRINNKQLSQLQRFLIMKTSDKQNICFRTVLIKTLSIVTGEKHAHNWNQGYLISYYPSKSQHLNIAISLGKQDEQDKLQKIIEDQEREKVTLIQSQIILFEEKINELRIRRRIQEEKTSAISLKCKKIIDHMAEYLVFLNKHQITSIKNYIASLEKQNTNKLQELESLQTELKQINSETISNSQNKQYFYDKMVSLKNNALSLVSKNQKREGKHQKKQSESNKENKQNKIKNNLQIQQIDQKCPQYEQMKQAIWGDLSKRIHELQERKQFLSLVNELKVKGISKEYTKITEQYSHLLNE